jgi:hypothetical protein
MRMKRENCWNVRGAAYKSVFSDAWAHKRPAKPLLEPIRADHNNSSMRLLRSRCPIVARPAQD